MREGDAVYLPKMTGVQYAKKVQEYLKNHLDHIVIHRLRTNQPPRCGESSPCVRITRNTRVRETRPGTGSGPGRCEWPPDTAVALGVARRAALVKQQLRQERRELLETCVDDPRAWCHQQAGTDAGDGRDSRRTRATHIGRPCRWTPAICVNGRARPGGDRQRQPRLQRGISVAVEAAAEAGRSTVARETTSTAHGGLWNGQLRSPYHFGFC